jgi:hypothetical protein
MLNFERQFDRFSSEIKKIGLEKTSFQDSLDWGELYGRVLYTNYPNVYRDDDFEKRLISRYISEFPLVGINTPKNNELHIISEPYSTGGHTRLLEKILKVRGRGDVLVTRPLSSSKEVLNVIDDSDVYFSEKKYSVEEIINISSPYETIFLHIHPDDLTCSVAMGVIKEKTDSRIIFVNHADHIFSYGYYSSSVVAEMGPFGDKLKKVKRRGESTYLGLPFDIETFGVVEQPISSSGITILSGATSFKYKAAGGLSFEQLVEDILERVPNSKFIIIGPDITFRWRKLLVKFKGRLRVVAKLPYEEYKQLLRKVDVYIDSFPLSGGTTVPEVRAKGIPVTGVLCGSYGYTPWDKTKYASNDELVSALKELNSNDVPDIIKRNNDELLIVECNEVHGFSHFENRLCNLVSNGIAGDAHFTHEVNYSYFNTYWKQKKKLLLGKRSYLFLLNQWSAGGKDVLLLAMAINPLKYSLKIVAGYLKQCLK